MKKIFFFISILLLFSNLAFSQAHEKGNFIISPHIGVGNWDYYIGSYGFPVGANFDFAVHKYADVGPYAGILVKRNYLGINFGARGNFNWWQLLDDKVAKDLKADKIDLYYTLGLGYEIFTDLPSDVNRFRWSSAMGIRWYFAEKIGLMAEVGAPMLAPIHIGVSIKL